MEASLSQPSVEPEIFEEFFDMGLDDSVSPFLTPSSRLWAINLTLKASILAAVLLVIAFIFSFFFHLEPISYFFLIGVYFFAGIPSLIEAIEDIGKMQVNIDVLMTLAAFSSVLIGSAMEGGLLLVLFALSGAMEDAVTAKAKDAISSLHKISPTKANVIDIDDTILERSIKDINVGTHILIKSGEVVPLDGIVIGGISSVNLVHLTGENMPVTKKVGDEVAAGAYNLEGVLTLRVTHTSADSTLAKIIDLVTQAQEARPKLQRWFDKVSERYALSIIGLAFVFALTFPLILGIPFLGVEGSIYRALAFLIAASPCALIIAIPIAYLSAVSSCARKGILLKGGITLDALASCSIIAFDKTGTLTTGKLTCLGIEALNHASSQGEMDLAIAVAAAMEKNVVHPIATSIVDYANQQKTPPVSVKDFKSIPGYGLEGILSSSKEDIKIYIGRPDYIAPNLPKETAQILSDILTRLQKEGELITVMLMGEKLYYFSFRDTLRSHIKEAIQELKKNKRWKLVMLTGDHHLNAKAIANEVGIDEYYANLSPADKLEHVSNLSREKGLAMIGDGVNDAPALARATVGICMGKIGSATAIEAADVVLLHDDLTLLDWLMLKASQTQLIVKQNLGIATLAIIFAAFPALAGLVPLWLAVVMHEGGTIIVGLNALRLLRG